MVNEFGMTNGMCVPEKNMMRMDEDDVEVIDMVCNNSPTNL